MSNCLDCEDKAKEKNKQIELLRGMRRTEVMAICMTPEGYEYKTLEAAMQQQAAIKEVLFPT